MSVNALDKATGADDKIVTTKVRRKIGRADPMATSEALPLSPTMHLTIHRIGNTHSVTITGSVIRSVKKTQLVHRSI